MSSDANGDGGSAGGAREPLVAATVAAAVEAVAEQRYAWAEMLAKDKRKLVDECLDRLQVHIPEYISTGAQKRSAGDNAFALTQVTIETVLVGGYLGTGGCGSRPFTSDRGEQACVCVCVCGGGGGGGAGVRARLWDYVRGGLSVHRSRRVGVRPPLRARTRP
eukprot:GHVU01056052.1.p5 GENE.GHVU01056052.1~~GHVU01056052.1.p5  ORF type:complete len:163 (+),score=19.00 GHVU01056052.1:448-936(+)